MGTDCKSAAFQLRWFESTRAHQEVQHPNRVLDLLFCRNFFRAERADSNSCGAVAEDSAKTAQWAVFSSAACAIHPRPPRTPVSEPGTGVSVLSVLQKGLQGWIRTATATTAASGRNREELLGLRPAGCACRPRHDAAAGSRDPGSFNPPAPTQKPQRIKIRCGFVLRYFFLLFLLRPPIRAAVQEYCFAQ